MFFRIGLFRLGGCASQLVRKLFEEAREYAAPILFRESGKISDKSHKSPFHQSTGVLAKKRRTLVRTPLLSRYRSDARHPGKDATSLLFAKERLLMEIAYTGTRKAECATRTNGWTKG